MLLDEFFQVVGHRCIVVYSIVGWVAMVSQILAANQRNVFPSPPYQRLTRAYTRDLRSRARTLLQLDDEPEDLGARSHTYWCSCCFVWSRKARAKRSKGHDPIGVYEAHAVCMPSSARVWNTLKDIDVSKLRGEAASVWLTSLSSVYRVFEPGSRNEHQFLRNSAEARSYP